jgi:4-amino-4-deoxy-L-arabinose transferase-like glycosyltransferase
MGVGSQGRRARSHSGDKWFHLPTLATPHTHTPHPHSQPPTFNSPPSPTKLSAMRHRLGLKLLLLLLAAFGVYLVGNQSVPLWDRDEPRFAQTSRQMLQSGDWVVPRLYDNVRTAKPPLIYWVQAASMKLIGQEGAAGVFAARLPSSIAMTLTLSVLAVVLWRHVGAGHAMWTVLILSTCALVVLAAKAGLTDSVLLLFVTIAQLCLYAAWRGHGSWGVTIVMAAAIALALLTKGPVAVGIQAMTLIGLGLLKLSLRWAPVEGSARPAFLATVSREASPCGQRGARCDRAAAFPAPGTPGEGREGASLSTLACESLLPSPPLEYRGREKNRPEGHEGPAIGKSAVSAVGKIVVGLLIVLAIGLPWVVLVEKRHPGFISTALNHEIKDRAASGLEGHKGPPGYYLLSIWPTFLPWSLVLPLALVMGWKNRRDPRIRFALAAVAGPWVMFEVVQTKLPHYLLPCFPPLAFLAADAILRAIRMPVDKPNAAGGAFIPGPMEDTAFGVGVLVWAGVAVLLGAVPWAAAKWFRPLPWGAMGVVSICAAGYALTVVFFFRRRQPAAGLATMGIGMLGLSLVLFGLYLPAAPFLQLSNEAGQVLRDHGVTGPKQVVMLDYKEPSVAFYQGGTIREGTAMVASDKLLDSSPPWLVITDEVYYAKVTDRSRLEVVARFKGLDLSAGLRVIEVLVVKKKEK